LEQLDREHFVRLHVPDPFLPFAEGGFGTADGKCHFKAATLDYTPPVESRHGDADLRARYPLELISAKNDDSMNSTFGHRDAVDLQTATIHMSAADAGERMIRTADQVRAFNDRGSFVLTALVDNSVRPGVVSAPSVRWAKRAPGGVSANAVTSARLTDAGGGPTFYSCLVQVERVGD
jgi:anaerobic selenocysteine-containing dehydrogenase